MSTTPVKREGSTPKAVPASPKDVEGAMPAKVAGESKGIIADIQTSGARYSKLVEAGSDKAPPALAKYLKMAAPCIGMVIAALEVLTPIVVRFGILVYKFLMALPKNVLSVVVGLALVFFGGLWPMTISAYEAAQVCGGAKMYQAIQTLASEGADILEKSKEDDAVDDDGDGIADVDQISSQDLLLRKTQLVLKKCNPEHIQHACGALYTSLVGVVAALRIEYARVIALAVSIGNMLRKPAKKFVEPALDAVVPNEYKKWVPVLLDTACKMIGVSVAWILQRILSAIQSALRGANLFVDGAIALGKQHKKLPDWFDPDQSYMDEVAVYGLAFIGVYFQIFVIGFDLPFPLNLVFMPMSMVEWTLRWVVVD